MIHFSGEEPFIPEEGVSSGLVSCGGVMDDLPIYWGSKSIAAVGAIEKCQSEVISSNFIDTYILI